MRPARDILRYDWPEPVLEAELDLDETFRRYAPYVAAIGLRLLGRSNEIDDLVQDVFMAAHRGLPHIRNPKAIKGWLATVTVRVARRRLRHRRLLHWVGLEEADSMAAFSLETDPEARVLLTKVCATLDSLPVEPRLAWSLRHIAGEPLDRVAELCGCSVATAKRRISAADRRIGEAIDG